VVDVTAHSHAADTVKVQATKVMESLKQEDTVNRATPGQLMTDSNVNAAVGVRSCGRSRCCQADYLSSKHGAPCAQNHATDLTPQANWVK